VSTEQNVKPEIPSYDSVSLADAQAAEQWATAYVSRVGVSKETMIDSISTLRAIVTSLTEQNRQLREQLQRAMDLVRYSRQFLFDAKLIDGNEYAALVADSESGQRVARLESYDALREKLAAMEAPVTDEELTPHLLGKKWPITEAFDALIAARAAKEQP
jgi:hypothetical protein